MNDTASLVEMLKEVCTENSIMISQAYEFFRDEMTLVEFKASLKSAWQQGVVSLSRCDMPELFGAAHFDASELQHGVAAFHMVQARSWK